jgi:hypothetical protein
VIPRNVAIWNAEHTQTPATWELMTGTDDESARMQIRLGIWILRDGFVWLTRYGFGWPAQSLTSDQIRLALMVYAWGGSHLAPYLDQIVADGAPLTAAEIEARWPALGEPANAPLRFSKTTFAKAFGAGSSSSPAPRPLPVTGRVGAGAVFLLTAVFFALLFSKKK